MTATTTHFIINYLIGKRAKVSKILIMALAFGGIAPDLDVIPLLFSYDLYLQIHRAWFHSPFVGIIFGLVFVLILHLLMRNRKIPYFHAFLFFILGFWLHLLWDFISIGSMNILSPFGEFWIGMDLLGGSMIASIILDLAVLLTFLASCKLKFLEDFRI